MKKLFIGIFVSLCFVFAATPLMAATPFGDIRSTDWFYGDVDYAYNNSLFAGVTDSMFGPNDGMTRAMFVTVLGRVEGIDPDGYYGSNFDDVDYDSWYYNAVYWAYDNGIVNGTGNGQFSPNELITREQMATIIANYIGKSGHVLPDSGSAVGGFSDSGSVSSWAKSGLELMRKSAIIQGDTDGNFNPGQTATRAQCAAIFHRLKNGMLINTANIKDARITIEDCYFSKDSANKNVIVVRMLFTNIGSNVTNFEKITMDYAYQNGVELDNSFDSCAFKNGYNTGNDFKNVLSGGQLEVQRAYVLNGSAPVKFVMNCFSSDGGFSAIQIFNVQ